MENDGVPWCSTASGWGNCADSCSLGDVDFAQILFLKKKKKDFKEQSYSVSQKLH